MKDSLFVRRSIVAAWLACYAAGINPVSYPARAQQARPTVTLPTRRW